MVGGGVGTEVVFYSSAHRSRNQGLWIWAPWRGDFDDANDIRVQSRGGDAFLVLSVGAVEDALVCRCSCQRLLGTCCTMRAWSLLHGVR